MRFALCVQAKEQRGYAAALARREGKICGHTLCTDRSALLSALSSSPYDAAVVALDGAEGMETVIGVREVARELPLVWISDDKAFVPQSYRLRTTFFILKSTPEKSMEEVLTRLQEKQKERKEEL